MSGIIFTKFFDPVKMAERAVNESNLILGIRAVGLGKDLAHVETGQHRNSMGWKTKKETGGQEDGEPPISETVNDQEIAIGATSDHSVYAELGTKNMSPQPAIRPAVDRYFKGTEIGEVVKKISKEIARGPLRSGQTRETF